MPWSGYCLRHVSVFLSLRSKSHKLPGLLIEILNAQVQGLHGPWEKATMVLGNQCQIISYTIDSEYIVFNN